MTHYTSPLRLNALCLAVVNLRVSVERLPPYGAASNSKHRNKPTDKESVTSYPKRVPYRRVSISADFFFSGRKRVAVLPGYQTIVVNIRCCSMPSIVVPSGDDSEAVVVDSIAPQATQGPEHQLSLI